MAVGDVVNGLSAAGVALSFQPAVGVEVCITSFGSYNSWTRIENGIIGSNLVVNGHVSGNLNSKIMINNTNYINLTLSADGSSYSGIQIK